MYLYNMHEGPLKVDNSMRDWFLDTEALHICRGFAVLGDLSSRLCRHMGRRGPKAPRGSHYVVPVNGHNALLTWCIKKYLIGLN